MEKPSTSPKSRANRSPTSSDPAASRSVPSEKPNLQVAIFGVPGSGKTTRAKQRIREACASGWFAVIHDPNDDYERLGPEGDIEDLARAADRAAREKKRVHPVLRTRDDAVSIMEDVKAFSALGRRKTLLVFDESVLLGSPRSLEHELADLIARRRHHGIGILFVAQFPSLCHFSIMTQATELDLFRVIDAYSLKKLEERGVPREVVMTLPDLDNFQFRTVRPGQRITVEPQPDEPQPDEPQPDEPQPKHPPIVKKDATSWQTASDKLH